MDVTYVKDSKLTWPDLWDYFYMEKDKGDRWYPSMQTPDYVKEYLSNYRTPSRSWPKSYATAMLTQKFAKLVVENNPSLALDLGLAEKL